MGSLSWPPRYSSPHCPAAGFVLPIRSHTSPARGEPGPQKHLLASHYHCRLIAFGSFVSPAVGLGIVIGLYRQAGQAPRPACLPPVYRARPSLQISLGRPGTSSSTALHLDQLCPPWTSKNVYTWQQRRCFI